MNKKEIEERVDSFIAISQEEPEDWKEKYLCKECLLRELEKYVIKGGSRELFTLTKCECEK
jgi:hypothetical protein